MQGRAGHGRRLTSFERRKCPFSGLLRTFSPQIPQFHFSCKVSKQYWLQSGVNKKLLIYWPLQEFYQSNCLCRESFKLSTKNQNFPAIAGYTFSTPKLFTEYERTEDALSKITVLINPARLFVEFTPGSFGA